MAMVAPTGCLCEELRGEAPDFSIFMGNLEGVLSLELGAHKG